MLFKSQVYTQASGSVGGITYSHNRGGLYTRARAIPVNPATAAQAAIRGYVTTSVNRWMSILTEAQRAAWRTYAENVPVTNRLGEATFLTGQQHYIRSRVPRRVCGLAGIDTAPSVFNKGSFTNPVIGTASAAAQTVSIAYTNTDQWATEAGGGLLVFISRPVAISRVFFKGPYRFAEVVLGAVVPPTSPEAVTVPFAFTASQRLFVRITATQIDGRYSDAWTGFVNTAA